MYGRKEVNRLLYRSGNEKKFFSEASIPLSTLQRNDKSSPKLCGHDILFFVFLLINYLFVKNTLTTASENKCFSTNRRPAIRVGLQAQKSSGKDPEILHNKIKKKAPYYLWLLATVCLKISPLLYDMATHS